MSDSREIDRRLAELQRRVDALENAHPPAAVDAPRAASGRGRSGVDGADDAERSEGAEPAEDAERADRPEVYWALEGLKRRAGSEGAVLYTGAVDQPGVGRLEYQYALPVDDIAAIDWSLIAPTVSALSHPVRLAILQAVFRGTRSSAELLEVLGAGTTGQLYHHVNQLIAAGWLRAKARGEYQIPPERVVALLAIIVAAQR